MVINIKSLMLVKVAGIIPVQHGVRTFMSLPGYRRKDGRSLSGPVLSDDRIINVYYKSVRETLPVILSKNIIEMRGEKLLYYLFYRKEKL